VQFPITIGLRRSFLLSTGFVMTHGLALLVVWMPDWPAVLSGLISATILLVAWHGWRAIDLSGWQLRLLSDGHLECQAPADKNFMPVVLLPRATAHPWLTVLRIEQMGKIRAIVVALDSAGQEDRRRLRLWLRWRAEFSSVVSDVL